MDTQGGEVGWTHKVERGWVEKGRLVGRWRKAGRLVGREGYVGGER